MTRPPFPMVIDNTIRSSFVSCPRKAWMEYLRHYKPIDQSVHLHAGGAYAHGLEKMRTAFYQDGHSAEDALAIGLKALMEFYGDFECPATSAKSLERMLGALEFYASAYPLESDAAVPTKLPGGKLGIEFSFTEPLEICHPETGDPLLYVGRMDMLADYAGGIYILDDKTTSSLGASWSKQWDLRSQFTGYAWGCRQAGIETQGVLVRGVSILKYKYDTQQALTYRPSWQIDRWYEQIHLDLARMIRSWESGEWDYNIADACNEYGGCVFSRVCQSQNAEQWLKSGFTRRVWDPVERTEVVLGEEEAE